MARLLTLFCCFLSQLATTNWRNGERMLIDLRLDDKKALVIGGGTLGERKVRSLLSHCPDVTVISITFTPRLKALEREGKITLIEGNPETNPSLLQEHIPRSDLIFAATNNHTLNQRVSELAREHKVLVCAVDMPALSDFYSPAIIQKGSIRVGICTDGKSPLMSRVLRKRLETKITDEDALHVELQHHARTIAKERIKDGKTRRDKLYELYEDPVIRGLLGEGKLEEAKEYALNVIKEK